MAQLEKVNGKSMDLVRRNIETLKQLFPEVVREGKVDFDALKLILGEEMDDSQEKYDFTWAGKKKAIRRAMQVSTGTLRPSVKESRNWDSTRNLYIEGDNLEVLRLLQQAYYNRVKMIYIDPPYNTGNDFVYNDDFTETVKDYVQNSGQALQSNPETSGRFHSNWLNMMYPRLRLARNLLSDEGVILISIDDNEAANLKKLCDEIFGEENFVSTFVWRGGKRNAAKYVSVSHEYLYLYAKSFSTIAERGISWKVKKEGLEEIYRKYDELKRKYGDDYAQMTEELKKWYASLPEGHPSKAHRHYCNVDARGIYFASDISRGGGGGPKFDVINPLTGNKVKVPSRGWSYSTPEEMAEAIKNDMIHFTPDDGVPCQKRYLKDNETQLIESVFYKDRRAASIELRQLFNRNIFDFPKDVSVIKYFISAFVPKDGEHIVLDFFSGSATTAHAVMELNAEDGGNRRFIMVQLPEPCDEKSEAYKAGYRNIAEIGKERIRLAGDKIVNETGRADLDIGFKMFKLDTSNLKEWDAEAEDLAGQIALFTDPVKPGRTALDVVYEVMLKYGIDLATPVREEQIQGKTVYDIGGGALYVCLADDITAGLAREIASRRPRRVVFRDAGFADDNAKLNAVQLLKDCGIDDVRAL